MNSYFYLILAFFLNSLGTIFIKIHALHGFQIERGVLRMVGDNIFFIAALFLFALNLIAYSLALGRLPLSVVYPVMTIASFIIVNTFSFFYFRENIAIPQIVGYVCILTGIFLVIFYAKS